jgi:hypothetical protein
VLLGVAARPPSPALADGDPASDVLASQPLFASADGGFAPTGLAQLNGLLAAAQREGVPIRVALIASPADLGSVSELWRRPQSYARFLGQELSQVYRGDVVVVMPNGTGTFDATPPRGADSLRALRVAKGGGAAGRGLIPSAVVAVQALALAAGHRVALPTSAVTPSASSGLGSVDLGSWLGLGAGAALIAAAWTASLRARPARPARRLRRAR